MDSPVPQPLAAFQGDSANDASSLSSPASYMLGTEQDNNQQDDQNVSGKTISNTIVDPKLKRKSDAEYDLQETKRLRAAGPDRSKKSTPKCGLKKKATSARPANLHPDEAFLLDVVEEYKTLKPAKSSARQQQAIRLMPFLKTMSRLPDQYVQKSEDKHNAGNGKGLVAYVLNSHEARQLLAGSNDISIPVFVTDGAKNIFDISDTRRPMEQALNDWFVDQEEKVVVRQLNLPEDTEEEISFEDLRTRFLANKSTKYPYNLPDFLNPMAHQGTPELVQSLNCNFLEELMRRVLDINLEDICQDNFPNRVEQELACENHRLTVEEFTSLHHAWRHWHGTIMIAEAGATTYAHWDKYGLGTWISCYEGEIGFCWQSHPTDHERTSWQRDLKTPQGQYYYKVIRAGEALYMPPGTVHVVFRRPQGGQTLAFSGHILRRTAIGQWLHILNLEIENVIKYWEGFQNSAYELMVPPILKQIASLLGQDVENSGVIERCGGEAKYTRAAQLTIELMKKCIEIVNLAAGNDR